MGAFFIERIADLEQELEDVAMDMAVLEQREFSGWSANDAARYASLEQRARELDEVLQDVWAEGGGNRAWRERLQGAAR